MSWKLYQIDRFLMSLDFNKSVADPNLYYYNVGDGSLIFYDLFRKPCCWIQVILDF
jgi:hypothetical protein